MSLPNRALSGALAMCLLLAACGGAETEGSTTSTSSAVETTTSGPVTSTTAPATTTSTSAPATTTTVPEDEAYAEIVIEGGDVVGGVVPVSVELGSEVHLIVVSDVAEHLHVHGYDLFFDLVPGEPVDVEFTADVPGVFEIELEGSHTLIAELMVAQ